MSTNVPQSPHASYTPATRQLHASYTPVTRQLHSPEAQCIHLAETLSKETYKGGFEPVTALRDPDFLLH